MPGSTGCVKSVSGIDVPDIITGDADVQTDADIADDGINDVVPADVRDAEDTWTGEIPDNSDVHDDCYKNPECSEPCDIGKVRCLDGKCHGCCEDSDCQGEGFSPGLVCGPLQRCQDVPNDCDGLCELDKPFCVVVSGIARCFQCQVDDDCTGISPACSCSEDAGWSCVMQFGTACQPDVLQCNYPEDLPTTWGPAGVANYLHVPANADEKVVCFDYTGDGLGDCQLTGSASQINPPLADMITAGKTAIVLEFKGVGDLTYNPGFTLYGVVGTPVTEGILSGDIYADTEDILFNKDTCEPAIIFDAEILDGVLTGQSDKITVRIFITSELAVPVVLVDARISAVLVQSGTGVEASEGVMSGVVTKQALTEVIDGLQEACDMDPQPAEVVDICPYLRISPNPVMLFDLHQMEDGSYINKDAENYGDAMSVCFTFTLAPATIVGYRPAN
jgi:hypothetical protein